MDGGLELNIADFVPKGTATDTVVPRADLEALSFSVPFSDLCNALRRGERRQLLEETTPPPEIRAGQKRVRFTAFEWSPEEDEANVEVEDGGKNQTGSEHESRSSSKRRRLSSGDRSTRNHMDSGSGQGKKEAVVVTTRHRRASSRVRSAHI